MKKLGMELTLDVDYKPEGFQDVLAKAECKKFFGDAESSLTDTLKSGLKGSLVLLVAAVLLPVSLPLIFPLFIVMILFVSFVDTEDQDKGIVSRLKLDFRRGCVGVVVNLLCCSCLVWLPMVMVTAAAANLAQVASNNTWLGAWFGVGGLLVLALCRAMYTDSSLCTNGNGMCSCVSRLTRARCRRTAEGAAPGARVAELGLQGQLPGHLHAAADPPTVLPARVTCAR